jgi:sporadic carbohydrate cluster protein (TIGR04323 family)
MSGGAKHGFRGYVSARPFGGYNIPVPVQGLVLRDYCSHHKLFFILPVNENVFPHSYMVLDGLVRDLSAVEGVVMCSMRMLPQRQERRLALYDKILGQGCQIHFALEETIIAAHKDISRVEDFLTLPQVAATKARLDTLRSALVATDIAADD